MSKEYNSSGERLYLDLDGIKCNLRGMLRREPEWLLSRFQHMESENERLMEFVKLVYCSKTYEAGREIWQESKRILGEYEEEGE